MSKKTEKISGAQEKIVNFLEGIEFGASAVEISKKTDVSRPTVLKYLEVMRAQGKVDYEQAGMAKLWHSHKPHLLEMLEEEKNIAKGRLRSLLNLIGDGVAILNKDMKFVWVDKEYKDRLRNQRGKVPRIIDNSCKNVFRRGYKTFPDYKVVEKALVSGNVETCIGRYISVLNGKQYSYEVQGSPIKDNKNNIVGVVVLRRDLTERIRLEEELKAAKKRYKEIFENINVGIYRTAPGKLGRRIDINPAYIRMFKYKDKEDALKSDILSDYLNPKDKEEFTRLMKKQGYVENWETCYKKRDGSLIWTVESAVAVRDEKGKIKYYDGIIEDITKRKELEEALEESERRLLDISNNINIAIYRSTPEKNGRLIEANPAFMRITGYKNKKELLGMNVSNFYIDPKDREIWRKKLLKEGYLRNYEIRHKKKDGSLIWIRDTSVVVKDKNGKIKYFDGFIEDITEKKNLEVALMESKERLADIFNNISAGVYRTIPGKKGKFLDVNPATVKMFGYSSKEEFLKVNVCDIYKNPKDREESNKEIVRRGHVKGKVFEYKKKDGNTFWGRLSDNAVFDDEGKVKYYDGIIEDITRVKKLEEKLKESEEKYRTIFENINVSIYRVTPGKKGNWIDANPYTVKMYGYKDREELLKSNVCDIYWDPKGREKYSKKLKEKGYVRDEIIKIKRKDGTPRWVKSNAVAIYDEKGKVKYYDGVDEDITERIELGESLKESEENYRTIFENLNVGISRVTSGSKGRFIDVNSAFLKMLGYKSREELLKINVCNIYQNPGDRKRFSDKMLKYGQIDDEILRLKRKDGSLLLAKEKAIAVYDEKGRIKHFDCITEDITKKKKAEEKYLSILESIGDAFYFTSKKGKVLHMNQAGIKLFGYKDIDEFLSISSVEKIYANPKDRKKFQKKIEKEGFVKDFKIKLKKKGGTEFTALITSNVKLDRGGNIIGYEGIIKEDKEV